MLSTIDHSRSWTRYHSDICRRSSLMNDGGLKLHQYHTQMASLKWKLRPSTSVNDALETSTASSSSLEDVSALTGAISRLRRQSPMYARRLPILQRRPQHIESGSSSDLARDLSEALHSISTLSIEHGDQIERPPSPPHSAGLTAPSAAGLLASSPLSGPPSLPSLVGVGVGVTLSGTGTTMSTSDSAMSVLSTKRDTPDTLAMQDQPAGAAMGAVVESSSSVEGLHQHQQPPVSSAAAPSTSPPGSCSSGVALRDAAAAGLAQFKRSSLLSASAAGSTSAATGDMHSHPSQQQQQQHHHHHHHLTTAERFALTNQCTMRKGSPRSVDKPGPRTEHGVAAVSPPPPPAPSPFSSSGYPGAMMASGAAPSSSSHTLGVGQSRRSSCGTLSPMASSVPASLQKLKRMFTEPEKPDSRVMITPPPLSPKPPVKAKPAGLLNRQRLSPHLQQQQQQLQQQSGTSPRGSPPESPSATATASSPTFGSAATSEPQLDQQDSPSAQSLVSGTGPPTSAAGGSPGEDQQQQQQKQPPQLTVREYKQTPC